MSSNQQNIILKTEGLTKHYGGVRALQDADFSLTEGEHVAIVGDNGAGKSTLMKVLSGIYPAGNYDGDIIIDGKIKRFHSIKDSVSDGIVIINQELALFPNLTVYENVFVGHEIHNKASLMNWEETKKNSKQYLGKTPAYMLDAFGFDETNLDVTVRMDLIVKGVKSDSSFLWTVVLRTKFGRKLKEDRYLPGGLDLDKEFVITKKLVFRDKAIVDF